MTDHLRMASDLAQNEHSLTYGPWQVRANEVSTALFWCVTPGVIVSLALGAPWGFATAALASVAAVASVWRALRIRLVVTEQGVIIDNYWVTHSIPWSEIEGVSIALKGTLPRPALGFKKRQHRPVFAFATPLRRTERQEFRSAVLAFAPPSVQALPDTAGVIGSDRALSNQLRLWWVRRGRS
jgi:hypothetical protein